MENVFLHVWGEGGLFIFVLFSDPTAFKALQSSLLTAQVPRRGMPVILPSWKELEHFGIYYFTLLEEKKRQGLNS